MPTAPTTHLRFQLFLHNPVGASRHPAAHFKHLKRDQEKRITAANFLHDSEMLSHLAFESSGYLAAFLHTPALYFSAFCSRVMARHKRRGKTSAGFERKHSSPSEVNCFSSASRERRVTLRSQGGRKLTFRRARPLFG